MTRLWSEETSLHDQLARLLDQLPPGNGRLSDAARLRLRDEPWPVDGADVAPLAQLALALRSVPAARPDPEFRVALRARLLATAAAESPPVAAVGRVRERLTAWRRSVSVAVASALSAFAIGSAGVAVAAARAQPGQLLYPVKLAGESLRLSLADGAEAGRLELAYAERRLAEVTAGAPELAPATLVDTLDRMDSFAMVGAAHLLNAYDASGDREHLQAVTGFVTRQQAGLRAVIPQLPAEVVPFARRSLEAVLEIGVEAAGLATTSCSDCAEEPPSLTLPDPGPALPPPGCCPDSPAMPAEPRGLPVSDPFVTDGAPATAPAGPSHDMPRQPRPEGAAPPEPLLGDLLGPPIPDLGVDGLDSIPETALDGLDGLVGPPPDAPTPAPMPAPVAPVPPIPTPTSPDPTAPTAEDAFGALASPPDGNAQ